MKKLKTILIIFSILIISSSFSLVASAAVPKPASAVKIRLTDETVCQLAWKKASGAHGYYVYAKTADMPQYKQVAATRNTSCYVKNLVPYKTYYFKVLSCRIEGGQKIPANTYSNVVKIVGKLITPNTPTGLKTYQSGNRRVYLSWNKANNATGYAIYRYDTDKKKWVLAGEFKNKSGSVIVPENNVKYKFVVRSFRRKNGVTRYSTKVSNAIAAMAQAANATALQVRPAYYEGIMTASYYAKPANSKSKAQTVAKGTKVTVTNYATNNTVLLENGQSVYIPYNYLKLTKVLYNSAQNPLTIYSKAVRESFVNSKRFTSPTKYLIWVNTYSQSYTLFKGTGAAGKWQYVRSANVKTGSYSSPTGSRVCRLYKRCEREERFEYNGGYYQGPIIYFWADNAFHSGLRNPSGKLVEGGFGKPETSGCIRLPDPDINYIYNNIPDQTTVVLY